MFTGLLRGELALSVAGAAFLAVVLYGLIAVVLQVLLLRRAARALRLSLGPEELDPGEPWRLQASGPALPGPIPALTLRVDLRLRSTEGRMMSRTRPLARSMYITRSTSGRRPRRQARRIIARVPAADRGRYEPGRASLAIADLAGMASLRVSLDWEAGQGAMRVRAQTREVQMPGMRPARGGEEDIERGRLVRGEERIEVRSYHPGDDPRHLNWKLYAHSGELMLRIGEEVPPPRRRTVIVLLPPREGLPFVYLDRLASVFLEVCVAEAAQGHEPAVLLPGRPSPVPWRGAQALAADLSDLAPGSAPGPVREPAILVAGVGSQLPAGLPHGCSLVAAAPDVSPRRRPAGSAWEWIRRMLLRDEATGSETRRAPGMAAQLGRELEELKGEAERHGIASHIT